MDDKKEAFAGPIEQEINSMMGDAGNEIMKLTQKGAGIKEGEVIQKIHIVNLITRQGRVPRTSVRG